MGYPELAGRVAIVTGANHGIGAAIAQQLEAEGVRVLRSYWGKPSPSEVRQAIAASGISAEATEADLRDPETPARLFDAAPGPVDILINNASGSRPDTFRLNSVDRFGRSLDRVSADSASQQLDVDGRGSALMIAEFAKRHIERRATWGRIIGLTSGGPQGFPEEVSYGAAKAALENYAMSAAWELAEYGITSNVVYPPVTDTGWVTDAVRDSVAHNPQLIHIAQPAEIAEVIVFLCSNQARLITANILHLR